jgi:hypothetical protein
LSLVLNFKSNGIGTGLRSSKIKKLINNHYWFIKNKSTNWYQCAWL